MNALVRDLTLDEITAVSGGNNDEHDVDEEIVTTARRIGGYVGGGLGAVGGVFLGGGSTGNPAVLTFAGTVGGSIGQDVGKSAGQEVGEVIVETKNTAKNAAEFVRVVNRGTNSIIDYGFRQRYQ